MPLITTCARKLCDCRISGPWKAERWTCVRYEEYEKAEIRRPARWAWRAYNRPAFHIHSGEKYSLDVLVRNLKAANDENKRMVMRMGRFQHQGRVSDVLRMRNVETGDFIMADVL